MATSLLSVAQGLDRAQAVDVFVKQRVRKFFEPNEDEGFAGGWFKGVCTRVDKGLIDSVSKSRFADLLFFIEYEDGDTEHITLEEMVAVMASSDGVREIPGCKIDEVRSV